MCRGGAFNCRREPPDNLSWLRVCYCINSVKIGFDDHISDSYTLLSSSFRMRSVIHSSLCVAITTCSLDLVGSSERFGTTQWIKGMILVPI